MMLITGIRRGSSTGFLEAMDEFNLDEGYILTFNQKDEITVDDRKVSIIPVKDFDY